MSKSNSLNLVSFRIKSNCSVHGFHFAVKQEIDRFSKSGFSANASVSMALAACSAAIRHC